MQDLNSSAYYLFISTACAYGFWLDVCCVAYISTVTVSLLAAPSDGINGAIIGLAITQAMSMIGEVQWGMLQSAELENTMTAVERVIEYEKADPEYDAGTAAPPKDWPTNGAIHFANVSISYFPDPKADQLLKNIEFVIKPCERVGIVGRSGAGKSSLINALFRLCYNSGGHIYIDQLDTQSMALQDLRTKISIIPQEPVLFAGTLRYNLDPFNEYSDASLWSALEQAKMKEYVGSSGLESGCSDGGSNFSVGQRQLICLARAILRENRILVMDEATANVDAQTDAHIQTTIREKFGNCTILTVAHRLHTIMDCDKVLVLDAGRVIEYGSPLELLTSASESKMFYNMVLELGAATFDSLMEVAKNSAKDREEKGSITKL